MKDRKSIEKMSVSVFHYVWLIKLEIQLFRIEYILVHTVKCLFHRSTCGGAPDSGGFAYVTRNGRVLPDRADSNTGFQQCIHIGIMLLAPPRSRGTACTFWFGKLHALEMLENVVVRIIRIRLFQHCAVHPPTGIPPDGKRRSLHEQRVRSENCSSDEAFSTSRSMRL